MTITRAKWLITFRVDLKLYKTLLRRLFEQVMLMKKIIKIMKVLMGLDIWIYCSILGKPVVDEVQEMHNYLWKFIVEVKNHILFPRTTGGETDQVNLFSRKCVIRCQLAQSISGFIIIILHDGNFFFSINANQHNSLGFPFPSSFYTIVANWKRHIE